MSQAIASGHPWYLSRCAILGWVMLAIILAAVLTGAILCSIY